MNTTDNWKQLYKSIKKAEDNLNSPRTWDSMARAKERRSNFKLIQGGKPDGKKS
jgi:hypothetical protein|tara:strand:+ start:1592 stop:1753 length:162 start_codon:yes stop_codon:yes gene_type:complete